MLPPYGLTRTKTLQIPSSGRNNSHNMKIKSITERPRYHSDLKDLRRITFARPARWAPLDSMYARYLLNSRNSSMEGLKVMILQLGFRRLSASATSMVAGVFSAERRTWSSAMNYYRVKIGDHFSQMACKLIQQHIFYLFTIPSTILLSLISFWTAGGGGGGGWGGWILPLVIRPLKLLFLALNH